MDFPSFLPDRMSMRSLERVSPPPQRTTLPEPCSRPKTFTKHGTCQIPAALDHHDGLDPCWYGRVVTHTLTATLRCATFYSACDNRIATKSLPLIRPCCGVFSFAGTMLIPLSTGHYTSQSSQESYTTNDCVHAQEERSYYHDYRS